MRSKDKLFFPLLALMLLLWAGALIDVAGQTARPQPTPACPTVSVSGPDTVPGSQPITATANVSGGDPNVTPTFNWTVSAGTISSGQGTSSITIDTTGIDGQSVTASVDVGGYLRECSTFSSVTTSVMKAVTPRKFDEYGKIREEDEQARLDNFAVALQQEPTATGYLIAYGGRRSQADEAQKMLEFASNYLMNKRGIPGERSLIGVGGYREEATTELWIVPAGGAPPMATPNVDPSEVVIVKVAAKSTKAKAPVKAKTAVKTKTPVKVKPKTTKGKKS